MRLFFPAHAPGTRRQLINQRLLCVVDYRTCARPASNFNPEGAIRALRHFSEIAVYQGLKRRWVLSLPIL
jgi:hypothetical protein